MARAAVDWGYDADQDGLPDEVEVLVGGVPFLADTDGDGFCDGTEWVLGSACNDPLSQPRTTPSVRSYAYLTEGRLRVFCAVYPANFDLVDSFHLYFGSKSFVTAPEGDPSSGLGIIDATALLPSFAGSYTATQYLGLELVGFDFDLDASVVSLYGPLNLGFAARLADVSAVDRMYLGTQGLTEFVLAGGPGLGGSATSSAQPLDGSGGGGEEAEYCKVSFGSGVPAGVGATEYEVSDASCEPDGLLFCVDADCQGLKGQKIQMIDYGFLQSK